MKSSKISHQLVVNSLSCIRGDRMLFKKLSFKLDSGNILFVQGANGAGKTTLLRTLCGLSKAEAGQVLWNEQNIERLNETYHEQLVYLGHLVGIKEDLTPVENLQFLQNLHGFALTRDAAVKALTQLDIARCADLPTRVLSQGQKRRVALAQLWLANDASETPLWILDEPFTALDVAAIETLSAHIKQYANSGGMVLMTSHQEPNFDDQLMQRLTLNA